MAADHERRYTLVEFVSEDVSTGRLWLNTFKLFFENQEMNRKTIHGLPRRWRFVWEKQSQSLKSDELCRYQ